MRNLQQEYQATWQYSIWEYLVAGSGHDKMWFCLKAKTTITRRSLGDKTWLVDAEMQRLKIARFLVNDRIMILPYRMFDPVEPPILAKKR